MIFCSSYFAQNDSLVLSQRVIGLYTLTLNTSAIQLNSFARRALSQLTARFNAELYEDFINAWGTHIITQSLVGGMIEERAKVKRCFLADHDDILSECIPFSDRGPISARCAYYANQTRMISKRHLGGSVIVDNDNDWKRTLAVGPALLQILEMVPWYDFVSDDTVKENLRTIIQYQLKNTDTRQAEAVRQINARLSPCVSFGEIIINSS
ncbi:unnamed protein product, partial [Rotaria sp. Silwood2]